MFACGALSAIVSPSLHVYVARSAIRSLLVPYCFHVRYVLNVLAIDRRWMFCVSKIVNVLEIPIRFGWFSHAQLSDYIAVPTTCSSASYTSDLFYAQLFWHKTFVAVAHWLRM